MKDEFDDYIYELENVKDISNLKDLKDEDYIAFQELTKKTETLLGLTDRDLARMFTISIPSATRWKQGVSAPHPLMMKHVYKRYKEKAIELKIKKGEEHEPE